jgi:hypothetical protein
VRSTTVSVPQEQDVALEQQTSCNRGWKPGPQTHCAIAILPEALIVLALPGHAKHRRDPALFWNVSCGHSAHERIRLLPRNLPMAHADTLEPETTNTVFKAGAPRFAEVVLVEHQKRMCWPSGSEDTVGRPKNYQAKVLGTVSRTKRSANFSLPQVKHFLGCKKSTKSNTCGSLFTRSGALLF